MIRSPLFDMKKLVPLFFLVVTSHLFAQTYSVSGRILDDQSQPLSFATILLFEAEGENPISGATSDESGRFTQTLAAAGSFRLEISMIGFETVIRQLEVSTNNPTVDMGTIPLKIATEALDEALVVAKRPTITKEQGKLIFEVENTALATGNTLNLLKKTPGVLVVQDQITVKNSATTIYINGRRVYLSASEVASLLTNMDASLIKSVEVITNPPASFDAEGGSVLNILTSRAVSIGYKGSIGATYDQAIFPKYNLQMSHFYKNNWLNLYGSYGFAPRKEFKDQDDRIRYFQPDGSENSLWISDFNRTTESYAHQGNVIVDFTLSEAQELSATANVMVSPNKTFDNRVHTDIFGPNRQLDSLFLTESVLNNDTYNVNVGLQHKLTLGDKGGKLTTSANHIRYQEDQFQDVATQYFDPNLDPINRIAFFTNSRQQTQIWTAGMDAQIPWGDFNLKTGWKYSNIDTESQLDFFDRTNTGSTFNNELSDLFLYDESIYAGYAESSQSWGAWEVDAGVRVEYTDVNGDSRRLGQVNTQTYWEVFPTVNVQHQLNEKNTLGLSYARRIDRPRYESLNPFRYFLNENNFNAGNPDLRPGIDNKITLSYNYKNTWFVDVYYQETRNSISKLVFQDNQQRVIRYVDANLIRDFQYSFDLIYASSLTSWWYLSAYTSSFYLENEFFSVESVQETYSNSTYGFYGQLYNGLTFSKAAGLTGNVTAVYLSNYIYGSSFYKNQFSLSLALRKSLWDSRASLSVGVDDILNTNNVNVINRYFNQDNSYFPQPESRMFRLSFTYNFGNARLRDNNRSLQTKEGDRLN